VTQILTMDLLSE